MRWRSRMLAAGSGGKASMGVLALVVGVLVLTGLDKRVEAALVEASSEWLTALTTRFWRPIALRHLRPAAAPFTKLN